MKKPRKNLFTYSLNHLFTSQKPVKNLLPYSLNPFFPSKPGFTLAEVLITLGVIGVVVALTIPVLSTRITSARNAAKFKKDIASLAQALKMNQAKYDWDLSSNDPNNNWESIIQNNMTNLKRMTFDEVKEFYAESMKYHDDSDSLSFGNPEALKPESNINGYLYSDMYGFMGAVPGNSNDSFLFPDGAVFGYDSPYDCSLIETMTLRDALLDALNPDNYIRACVGIIDVNGAKGPNVEVTCADGTVSGDIDAPCVIDKNKISDIFPVVYYGSTILPASNAAKAVLHSK